MSKKFKSIICGFLLICILTTINGFAYTITDFTNDSVNTETETEKELEDIKKQAVILKKLGVFSFDDVSEIDVEKKITRAEFADYIVKAMNFTTVTDKVYFSDVKTDYWAAGSINALVERGVIDGTRNGSFEPDSYVTYGQVCKMVLAAAGYRGMIESLNYEDVMSGYIAYAKRLKLNEGVDLNTEDEVTMYNAAKLLYNGMKLSSVLSINDTATVEDVDLFEALRGVYISEGRVEAYFGGSITNSVCEDISTVYIEGAEYTLDSDISAEEFFGKRVELTYIKYSDDLKKIIYLEDVSSRNEVLDIQSLYTESFDAHTLTVKYTDSKNEDLKKNAKIAKGAKVIYNGEVSEKRLSDIFDDFINEKRYGHIKLVKTNGSEYDLCIVKSYEDFIVSSYNTDENKYFGSSASQSEVDFNSFENISVFDSSGNTVTLPANKNSVVALAPSENGMYMEAVSCLNAVSGVISNVKDSQHKLTIDNSEYELSKQAYEKTSLSSVLNSNVKAVLNLEGKVAFLDVQADGDYSLAYISKAAVENNMFSENPILKLYLPDTTELKIFGFADKVNIDGVSISGESPAKIFTAFPGGEYKKSGSEYKIKIPGQLIRYTLNKDGKINKIDTYNIGEGENGGNSLTRNHDGSEALRYVALNKRFGMDCIYDATNTKLIYVPQKNDEGEIVLNGETLEETIEMYKSKVPIWSEWNYYVESYKLNDKNYYEDVIVVRMETTQEDQTAFMFKEVIEALDDEGSAVKQLVGMTGSGEVNYFITDEQVLGDVEAGDIVMANINMTGKEVVSLTKMFDKGTMAMQNDGKNPYWYSGTMDKTGVQFRNPKYQLSMSYVYSQNNGIIRTTYDFYDMSKDITDESMIISSVPIAVYDEERRGDIITKGSVTDIRAYDTAGENCSFIVVFANYGQIKQAFVYR